MKEHQLDLFGERLSCEGFAANEVRLLLASFAQLLLERLCAIGLKGTALATATAGTIRVQLLKIAEQLTVSVRRTCGWRALSPGRMYLPARTRNCSPGPTRAEHVGLCGPSRGSKRRRDRRSLHGWLRKKGCGC